MNLPQRNNNPVNLKWAGQREAVKDLTSDFAKFFSPMAGWRGAHRQIELDQSRRLSIKQFIFKFAPPEENDSNAYLQFVCSQLNVNVDEYLSMVSKYALAGVMAQFEGYYKKEDL